MTLAVAGIALSAVSCDGAIGKMSSDRDSLSYALGANMGLSLNLGMGDLGLNNEVVIKELKSFFKDGDVESEEFQNANQRFMEFQYTRVYPYMQAKMQRDAIETDQPDTLAELPALYDDNFTAEEISTIVGKSMGARSSVMMIMSLRRATNLIVPMSLTVNYGTKVLLRYTLLQI